MVCIEKILVYCGIIEDWNGEFLVVSMFVKFIWVNFKELIDV